MKNFLVITFVFCLLLTGCRQATPVETTVPVTETTIATESTSVSYPVPSESEMPGNDSDVDWGLTLTAESVKRSGCAIRYTQSGGAPTGELQTGSFFLVEVYDGAWKPATNLHPDEEIAWNSLAYLITMNGETELQEDWSFLHGPLNPGCYRIGKEIMDFRGPGDYDKAIFYAYFEIAK